MLMRLMLFAGTNVAVLLVLSIVVNVLGIDDYLMQAQGLNITGLLIFSAVFGMAGSFISLLLSKTMAIRSVGARVIKQPANPTESWLVSAVAAHARKAGIGMPDVAIFESPDPNAFATGANRNASLVAVSSGLLQRMNRQEVDAVLGHEVAHIANGDMVTMTLLQGVTNTFVIFLSRVIGYVVDRVVFRTERGVGPGFLITSLVMQVLLGILATMIVMWFSRWREFRADAGGARFAGRDAMISALATLGGTREPPHLPGEVQTLGIYGQVGAGLRRLFMSHPPIEERIAALRRAA